MCGIIGSINREINLNKIQLLKHRGPDNLDYYVDDNVFLGHTRLSIQDLSSKSNQPFFSKNKDSLIVFNGEIYNHWDLRDEMTKKGVKFITTSDTETLLKGIDYYGFSFINKLNGIFSFCYFNIKKMKFFLARDRYGVKPLYYSFFNNQFEFSSEIKTFDSSFDDLNIDSIINYTKFLWSPGFETPQKSIKKLLPGQCINIDLNKKKLKLEFSKFYEFNFSLPMINDTENNIVSNVDELLRKSVNRQLISDVPVGFFLSGGLDSSLLVSIAKEIRPQKTIQCYTIDTTEFSESEGFENDLFYAKFLSKKLDLKLKIVKSDLNILKELDNMIWHLDEPQADLAPLHVLNISKLARRNGTKVLISGAGGDDIFSGYNRHKLVKYKKVFDNTPNSVKYVIKKIQTLIEPTSPLKRRVKKLLKIISSNNDERIYNSFEWLDHENILKLIKKPFHEKINHVKNDNYLKHLLNNIPKNVDYLNKFLFVELNTFLVDHNLNYTDKMGMSQGVEIRVPYLDNDLVDYLFRIPQYYKIKNDELKYILKKVAERYLPNEIIYRKKSGFGAPVRKWIKNDMDNIIKNRIINNKSFFSKLFDQKELINLIDLNKKNKIDASYSILAILAIESWLRQFLK